MHVVHIKNMVCPRCIDTVKTVFNELEIKTNSIRLGEVSTKRALNPQQKESLEKKLLSHGFELLKDQKSKLIGQIKALIIDQVHHNKEVIKGNFSSFLADKLNYEYSSLSRLFSSIEGITIEKFILRQKIEKVKELIFYNELTLSEIAYEIGYSSVAHLSTQFKKETGMSPSQFKQFKNSTRNSLDSI